MGLFHSYMGDVKAENDRDRYLPGKRAFHIGLSLLLLPESTGSPDDTELDYSV